MEAFADMLFRSQRLAGMFGASGISAFSYDENISWKV